VEKLANLDSVPRRTDVPLVTVSAVVAGGSAGWVRPVAMFESGTLG
jgi:kynurenine formamidase